MVVIQDLEKESVGEVDDIVKNSRAIQNYIQDENTKPVTSSFFITEKIIADIEKDNGTIP